MERLEFSNEFLEKLKAKFSNNWEFFLKADKRQKPCCPNCGSGTGKDKTSAADFVKGGFELHCLKCDFSGDVFKIYALQNDLDAQRDFPTIVKAVAESLNFTEGEECNRRAIAISKVDDRQTKANLSKAYNQLKRQLPSDRIRLYLKNRGFNDSIIDKFAREITSDIKREFPELIKAPIGSMVVLYGGNAEYFISRVFDNENKSVKGYFKLSSIAQPIFFTSALNKTTENTIFITEGELDALSIFQAGGFAASVGGGGGDSKLLEFLEKERCQGKSWKLILALDSDEAGKEHANKLAAKLKSLGFAFSTLEMAAKCKDPNEWLQTSPETLKKAILKAKQWAGSDSIREEEKNLTQDSLVKYSAANALKQFEKNISSGRYKPTPTGLKAFDDMLGGGLYPGLYVIAAATGFGKSTFCLQLADELAIRGEDVVYFSLEMSQDELIARSLSRLTYLKARDKKCDKECARTTRAILQRSIIARNDRQFIAEYNQVYSDALDAFARMADKLFYRDGSADRITITEVESFVGQLVESGRRPFVFIDYLQFLKTDISNLTDKQQADRVIEALKRLSTRYGITVVAISSINRQSYSSKAALSALKESGQIEFTGDAVLMIQPSEISDENAKDKFEEVLSQEERDLEVVLLKNRYGALGKAYFKFLAKFNLFAEITKVQEPKKKVRM